MWSGRQLVALPWLLTAVIAASATRLHAQGVGGAGGGPRPLTLEVVAPPRAADLRREVGAERDELRDVLERWLDRVTARGRYRVVRSTARSLAVDDLRPARGDVAAVARELRQLLGTLQVDADCQVRGDTILVTLR